MLKVLRGQLERIKKDLEKDDLPAQDRVEREQRRLGLESQITTLTKNMNPNQEHKGKKKGKDRERTISDSFKDIFFSDWVYRYDAGSQAERLLMSKKIEEQRMAEISRLKALRKTKKSGKEEEELANLKLLYAQRSKLGRLQNKDNRTEEENAELLELGKRFNGLADKEHKAGDAYSSADAYGVSGKAGRPGEKRYVVMKFSNGVDFYVEWDALLQKVVKRERGDVTSFALPDKWSLPIAIYITQEQKPVAIGNEAGSTAASETHGNRTVSVYKVNRIVNFETYDSIDQHRECLGDCGNKLKF